MIRGILFINTPISIHILNINVVIIKIEQHFPIFLIFSSVKYKPPFWRESFQVLANCREKYSDVMINFGWSGIIVIKSMKMANDDFKC